MSTPATKSFSVAAPQQARVLILGSHPGQRSLAAQQYYAHPRNRFWPLMQSLLGLPANSAYEQRLQALNRSGIALWDVLGQCVRPGSLDSAIERRSELANPIDDWLRLQTDIRLIAFNGRAAQQAFLRHFPAEAEHYNALALPSTSPANAAWSFEKLKDAWMPLRAALQKPATIVPGQTTPPRQAR